MVRTNFCRKRPHAAIFLGLLLCGFASLTLARPGRAAVETVKLGRYVQVQIFPGPGAMRKGEAAAVFVLTNSGPPTVVSIDYDRDRPHTFVLETQGRRKVSLSVPYSQNDSDVLLKDSLSDTSASRSLSYYRGAEEYTVARLGPIDWPMTISHWTDEGTVAEQQQGSWRNISGYTMLITEATFLADQPRWHDTLRQWIVQGGILAVVSESPLKSDFLTQLPLQHHDHPAGQRTQRIRRAGLGMVVHLSPNEIRTVDESVMIGWGLTESLAAGYNGEFYSPYSDHQHLRLSGKVGTPYGGLFLVLLLFVVLVGPLGWVRLVRKKAQVLRYMVFVVATSAVFTLGMTGVDMWSTGITPFGSGFSIRFIDQGSETELSIQDLDLLAPSRVGADLVVDPETMVLFESDRYSRSDRGSEEEKMVVRGLLRGRRTRNIGLRWVGKSRGRLLLSQEGDDLTIENHLGAAIDHIYLRHQGVLFEASSVASGAAAQLLRAGEATPEAFTVPTANINDTVRHCASTIMARHGRTVYLAEMAGPTLRSLEGGYRPLGEQRHRILGMLP